MSWSTAIRKIHRWTSLVFTAAFILVTIVSATAGDSASEAVYLLPLLPLGVLLLTGLYLFVLPYATRRRERRVDDGTRLQGRGT